MPDHVHMMISIPPKFVVSARRRIRLRSRRADQIERGSGCLNAIRFSTTALWFPLFSLTGVRPSRQISRLCTRLQERLRHVGPRLLRDGDPRWGYP